MPVFKREKNDKRGATEYSQQRTQPEAISGETIADEIDVLGEKHLLSD